MMLLLYNIPVRLPLLCIFDIKLALRSETGVLVGALAFISPARQCVCPCRLMHGCLSVCVAVFGRSE